MNTTDDIKLNVFWEQVGGCTPILRYDNDEILKLTGPTELEFYEYINPRLDGLNNFIPQYIGYIDITPNDILNSIKNNPPPIDNNENNKNENKNDNINIINPLNENIPIIHMSHNKSKVFIEELWGRLLRRLTKFSRYWNDKCRCLRLYDLTLPFQNGKPCILDLKVGTRHCKPWAEPFKKESQLRKVINTTSGPLGFRLCGMRLWKESTNSYFFRDKYWGRKLNIDQIEEVLVGFFHNGIPCNNELDETNNQIISGFHENIIKEVLRQLKLLLPYLYQYHDQLRFYSSSLLIIYDGKEKSYLNNDDNNNNNNENNINVVVKMIDFANICVKENDVLIDKPSDLLLFGQEQDIDIDNDSNNNKKDVNRLERKDSLTPTQSVMDHEEHADGYIFGIENLINILENILQNKMKWHYYTPPNKYFDDDDNDNDNGNNNNNNNNEENNTNINNNNNENEKKNIEN